VVSGNHDDGSDANIGAIAQCLPHRFGGPAQGQYGTNYYFDAPGLARFIGISPGLSFGVDLAWLGAAIDGARSGGLPWVVVFMHKNCPSIGEKGDCEMGANVFQLLLEKKVDLILQGHEHDYERSKQLAVGGACATFAVAPANPACVANGAATGYAKGAGSVVAIAGSGGTGLRAINTADSQIGYFATWMGSNVRPTFGFLKVTLAPTSLTGEFVATPNRAAFTDTFTITAP
jgi:hypothetical protein